MKHQLYTRTYEGDNREEVVVIGNRKDISDPVEKVMEAEFVFRDGKLFDVHVVTSRMLAFDDHLDDLAFEPSTFSKIPTEAEILADFGVVEPND